MDEEGYAAVQIEDVTNSPGMPIVTDMATTDDLPRINVEKLDDVQSPGALSQFVRTIDIRDTKKS